MMQMCVYRIAGLWLACHLHRGCQANAKGRGDPLHMLESDEGSAMTRRWMFGALVFAGVWMGWALLFALVASIGGVIARAFATLPRIPGVSSGWPIGWALVGSVLTAILVALTYALIGRLLAKSAHPSFAAGWLAAVLAGVVVGLVLDLPSTIKSIEMFGLRGALDEPYNMQKAVVWSTLAGWIPPLVVSRGRTTSAERLAEQQAAPRLVLPVPALVAATALLAIAVVAVGIGGSAAANAQAAKAANELAIAEGSAFGLLPDPEASGDPVEARAAKSDPALAGACTAENSVMLLAAEDAAVGRRTETIELMNISESPCVVEGYPDIAFGDQNNHLLPITLERSPDFLSEDGKPLRIELPPQTSVTAEIKWGANSTNGAIVAHSVHVAVRSGDERGVWQVERDIIEGSTVSVTPWHAVVPAR